MTPHLANQAAEAAREKQQRAANPARSVVLRASAGSGKTKVLVDRFVRLCIEAGPDDAAPAHPRSILAVTFTRKAAVEIQERLLQRAAAMALADRDTLTKLLTELFGDRAQPRPADRELDRAARLYEMILEDVSALNVGTIHSFCQTILNRFAVEAGLDPRFTVIEDEKELQEEALDRLEIEIATQPELAAAASAVADTPDSVRNRLDGFVSEQMRIQRWLDAAARAAGRDDQDERPPRMELLPLLLADLRSFLFPDLDPASEPSETDVLGTLRAAMEEFAGPGLDGIEREIGADGAATLAKYLKKLRDQANEWLQAGDSNAGAAAKIFLTGNKLRKFSLIRKDADLKEIFQLSVTRACLPALAALRRAKYLELYARNRGRLQLGLRALDIYDELKRRDRVVDFQDLEDLARRLMGDEARALSLLVRMDDSISHILLDEFQDTNFNQWEILEPFIDDFLAGGSGEGRPTVFFVGDVKQSIYAFRGAEPDLFHEAESRVAGCGESLTLPTNFRSLGAVVGSAGSLFGAGPLGEMLDAAERENLGQLYSRDEAPGEVVALEPFESEDEDDGRSGDQLAAEEAARIVRDLVEGGAVTWAQFPDPPDPRPLDWQDVLVLCRTRTEIGQYEKAFRDADIPIAPSGRGMLAAGREVQDILALLRWLVFPDDDVALATVLRSPLFRIGEADLQAVLARRGLDRRDEDGRLLPPRGLWRTLRAAPDDAVTGEAVGLLAKWRKNLDFLDCHAQLRRIYREGRVLERFAAALGDQARYNLLRLFDLAAGPELASAPTLRRLAALIERAGKRGGQDEGQLPRGGGRGRVRFMTVHGSKGLEAPVVLLVDADRRGDKESTRVRVRPGDANTPVLFGVTKEYREPFELPAGLVLPSDALQQAASAARDRGAREEAHLLYVALTRARDRLYVLGGDKRTSQDETKEHPSPLRRIREAAAGDGCQDVALELPEAPPVPAGPVATTSTGEEETAAPDIRVWQAPPMPAAVKEVAPSDVGGESLAPPPEAARDADAGRILATERGGEVHLLLQLAAEAGAMPPGDGPRHGEAQTVFSDPGLDWIFRPETGRGLCEAPFTLLKPAAGAAGPQRVTGEIDRLLVRDDRVDIIDYKTNRTGGDLAHRDRLVDHYRPQLEHYREAAAALYPGREIRTWLLFTDPQLPSADRLREVRPAGA